MVVVNRVSMTECSFCKEHWPAADRWSTGRVISILHKAATRWTYFGNYKKCAVKKPCVTYFLTDTRLCLVCCALFLTLTRQIHSLFPCLVELHSQLD